jgi:exonuclease III
MPWPFRRNTSYFKKIGEYLNQRLNVGQAPDVVLLQEAFTDNSNILAQTSGYPHCLRGEISRGKLVGSGLMVLSLHPITKVGEMVFKSASFWERTTSKGVLAAQIQVKNTTEKVFIFNTHMQAFLNFDKFRQKQVSEITQFLNILDYRKQNCIFAGDFNFSPKRDLSYQEFVEKLNFTHAADWAWQNQELCELIEPPIVLQSDYLERNTTALHDGMDHHFFYNPENSKIKIQPKQIKRNFYDLHDGKYLSDHFGYEVLYSVIGRS